MEREALSDLDDAVGRVLGRLEAMRRDVREARERSRKLEALLEQFRSGDEEPAEMAARVKRLERENRELRDRLERGRDAAERLLSRIRFLEEQR